MPADLHTHSNLSDGTDTPEELAEKAKSVGLTAIALTDHDCVDGIERISGKGIEVIPGIEFTTEIPKAEVHILGYFIDHKCPQLLEILKRMQDDRHQRIHKIVEKLQRLGIKITPGDVFNISGKSVPGRPHVARALIKLGAVSTFKEAFQRYLGFGSPAYVSHYKLPPVEAIKLIGECKGMPVFAHPGLSNCDELIPEFVAAGLKGLEVYYPGQDERRYAALAKKHGLLKTGGSDYHGEGTGMGLGVVTISDGLLKKLKDEHLRGNKS